MNLAGSVNMCVPEASILVQNITYCISYRMDDYSLDNEAIYNFD